MPTFTHSTRYSKEKILEMRNSQRKLNYQKRRFSQTSKRLPFSEMDCALILENPYQNDTKLAKYLKRSVQSIPIKRSRLRSQIEEKRKEL